MATPALVSPEMRAHVRVGLLLGVALSCGCYAGRAGSVDGGEDGSSGGGSEDGGDDAEGGSDGGDEGPDDNAGPFDCDPSRRVPSLQFRRLSKVQYRNAIRDITVWATGDDVVFEAVQETIDRLPDDAHRGAPSAPRGGFTRLDQDVQQSHIDRGYDIAIETAALLTTDHLEAVAGTCATDADPSNDDACIDDFIASFGERALRRPLDEEEVAFYRAVFDADGITTGTEARAFADVIAVMLTAPQFVYMVEHGEEPVPDDPARIRLGPFEQAQRLSFHFWQSPPDEALLEAARSGDLMTDEGYEAQVDRLLADPRARAAVDEFYREWLWLDEFTRLDSRLGNPAYETILDGFEVQPETSGNMVQELLDMASYYTLDVSGSFLDLMLSDRSFATTPDIAEIYGVEVWNGGEPPSFPDPERVGLISRAAMVASGTPSTRPIYKGVRIREGVLCEQLLPPPPDAAGMVPEISSDATTRELVEALTEQQGSNCAGCHATSINPLGFATENFDPIGRFRESEVLVDEDGSVTATRPVDTQTVAWVTGSDSEPVADAAELSQRIVDSEVAQACFARKYTQWTFGRPEDTTTDGCMLNAMTVPLIEGEPLAEAMRRLVLRESFKTRTIEE